VSTIWLAVGLTAVASFAIKAAGPALLGRRGFPPRAGGVISVLAPALLAGLVVSDLLGTHWRSADVPVGLGVAVAVVGRLAGAPPAGCLVVAVLTTALVRAVG
jgi:branched chain amino acid efflux pump